MGWLRWKWETTVSRNLGCKRSETVFMECGERGICYHGPQFVNLSCRDNNDKDSDPYGRREREQESRDSKDKLIDDVRTSLKSH